MRNLLRLFSIVVLLLAATQLPLLAAPANDNFTNATVISGFPTNALGTNIEATIEVGEPLPAVAGASATNSVWFSWTAPGNASVQIDTIGSNFDTILGVWSGTNLSSLTQLAENDDFSDGTNSVVFVEASAGVTYRIAVYGFQGEQGSINLNLTNDVTSRITGTVTGQGGTPPIQGIEALACEFDGTNWVAANIDPACTDTNGYYEIRGLTAGTYRVLFQNGDYISEYYDDVLDIDSGSNIVVGAGATVSNINASLGTASKISGTVTGPNGTTPLQGIYAEARGWGGVGWSAFGSAYTGTNGYYEIGGLTGGTYRVQFMDLTNNYYAAEVYNNATNLDAGTDITVGVAVVVSNINASLAVALTSNHSVPHTWLASRNPAWAGDYEAAVTNDADTDGFTTWQEYWCGTDPMNSNSCLKIDSIELSGTNLLVKWQHAHVDAGIPPIIIQARSNLVSDSWGTVGTYAPSNGVNTWSAGSSLQGFYRLAVTNTP